MKKSAIVIGLLLASTQVWAQDANTGKKNFDAKQIYFGGGLSSNDIDFDDSAIGYQVFAGMPLPVKTANVNLGVEVGYMDSGDFDRNVSFPSNYYSVKFNGLWGTVVASLPINNNFYGLGRLGLDIGDDDGVMIGAGVGFVMSRNMDLRVEFVARDHIDSLQLNLVVRQ